MNNENGHRVSLNKTITQIKTTITTVSEDENGASLGQC